MNPAVRARFVVALLVALATGPALAELKGTNATFYSWDDDPSVLQLQNSNSSIILDGKWHPFFAALNFDNNAVVPGTQSNGVVQCSATDTDGNGRTGTSTPWAGLLQLSVDSRDTGSAVINGFPQTRCWELAVCDRETNGTGSFAGSDLSTTPRYRRFAVDVTAQGACPTPTANAANGYVNPLISNGFITLLSQDVVAPCDQSGRCDQKIDTTLYVTVDRDCDGAIDDNDGNQVNNDPAAGNLNLIGSGGAGRIPLPVGNNDPQICFFAEGKKPDFTQNPQWQGNIQARITAPPGGSGEKTVNHSIIASPVVGDVGDLPTPYPAAPHVTNAFTNANPFIGSAPDNDTSSFFTTSADGDDLNNTADEGGVVLPPDTVTDSDGSSTIYTATVFATNQSGVPAQLCGWFDFDQDMTLDNAPNTSTNASDPNFALRSDAGERSCRQIPTGTANSPLPLSWSIPASAQGNTGNFYFRFRISFDQDMFDPILISAVGGLNSGEVQDHLLQNVGTLPVSISSFTSAFTAEGLEVSWSTVSETRNVGFHIWGDRGRGLEQLNVELVPSEVGDPGEPRSYALVIPGIAEGDVNNLAVTAVDFSGDEEVYGLFEPGHDYGRQAKPATIKWQAVRAQAERRAGLHRAERKRQAALLDAAGGNIKPDRADIRVLEPGLQEISWQMLADAGLDLSGVKPEDIAITFKGQPVARHVVANVIESTAPGNGAGWSANSNTNRFGPGSVIRFWGDAPAIDDALYIERNVYRVSVDASRAKPATEQGRGSDLLLTDSYTEWQRLNEQNSYHFMAPGSDPWYAQLLRSDRSGAYDATFSIDNHVLANTPGRLKISLGGLTAYDEAPDHNAQVFVNDQLVADTFFDGNNEHDIEIRIPANVLTAGQNIVRITAAGGQAAPRDLFVVDSVEIGYPRATNAINGRLVIDSGNVAGQIRADGFASENVLAYAQTGDGLVRLQHTRRNDGAVFAPAVRAENARYWISTAERVARPQVLSATRSRNLLAGSTADFLVIAHPAFLPLSDAENHPLNDYLAQRRAEGWKPRAFDITEIQAEYGYGMALPEALTAFLTAADKRFDYEHVLLIGNDSYDYMDRTGQGVVSFIPTHYAATRFIDHTPSDALLADLDGDGVADKAIGRWPVRTAGDLEAIVTKTLEWPEIANPQSAIWLTDSEDGRNAGFAAQAERMIDPLEQAGWNEARLDRVYFSEVEIQPGLSVAASARNEFFAQLADGRALTGFIGHGAPSMWSFQGLLTGNDLSALHNEGNPTLISTLACYTTYFVSTASDAVAHRWMNGYRTDAAGNRIPGAANGAVAIHGAAALSDYNQNESFAREVLRHQLEGATLGQATLEARRYASETGMKDLVINWTLLGDPTLMMQSED